MAKIKKKGTSGNAKNYITRTQAVRKLQISLPDFRRLCIFKGIYPREPRNKKKVSKSASAATTFYYTRDIQYLLHEPLLQKFRDHKALAKKIGRALGRGEVNTANRLEKLHTPKITLDHVIKERYPTFVDALRDLDDALSMLFLFANLPSTATVPPKTIARCQRLCLEFQHYLIVSHSLKKSFLSIKGIYYQATIQGQDVLWVVPYKFVQRMSGDIDFRIMGTFIEFYATLLGFVNYRLYTSLGLVYPPKFDSASDDRGAELGAFTLEGKAIGSVIEDVAQPEQALLTSATSAEAQKLADKVSSLTQQEPVDSEMADASNEQQDQVAVDAIDTFEPITDDADILPQPQVSSSEAASLFAKFTFFLSRETPRQPLEFLLKSFGAKRVGWDGVLGEGAFITDESDPSITHQIVDRPPMYQDSLPPVPDATESKQNGDAPVKSSWPRSKIPGRTYVQPQWVWDCINQGKLLRPDLYGPGVTLPPHLSPWAKAKRGEYDPTLSLAEQEREGEAEEHEEDEEAVDAIEDGGSDEEMDDSTEPKAGNPLLERSTEVQAGEGMDVAETESDSDSEDEAGAAQDDEWDGLPSDEESDVDEAEAARRQYQRELVAEAKGLPSEAAAPKNKAAEAKKKAQRKRREEEEETERQKMMLSRKKRKLFEKMQYSNKKTETEAEKIRGKRRKLEKKGAAPAA